MTMIVMRKICAGAVVCLLVTGGASTGTYAQEPPHGTKASVLSVPKALAIEHDAIHAALVEATKAPGAVGQAAQALANVLHPHFARENEIALPPLGLLARLAAGTSPTKEELGEALRMTDALRRELPRMLDEHKAIRTAVDKLRDAAKTEGAAKAGTLAGELALHAQTEEEVLYPAALLVGEIIRARFPQGPRGGF
jgi:hypothetical protein